LKFRLSKLICQEAAANQRLLQPSTADSTSLPTIMQVRDATVGPLLEPQQCPAALLRIDRNQPERFGGNLRKIVFVPWPISVLAARILISPSGVASAPTIDCR